MAAFTTVERRIDASPKLVFATISEAEHFSKAVPHIVKVEFLSEQRSGVGTRFRETRRMHGREATTELEVTEHVPNQRVRMVSDAGGTIWDSVFTVSFDGERTLLRLEMDARPHRLLARLMTPLIRRMVSKAVASDMDAVQTYCEELAQASDQH